MNLTRSFIAKPRSSHLHRLLALLLGILVAGAASSAEAYKWSHAGVDSSGDNIGQFISLVVGANGRYHVSYHRNGFDAGAKNLKYATKLNPELGGGWTTTVVDGSASMGSYSSITLAKSGPHIAYYDSEFGNLRHAAYDSLLGGWTKETVDAAGTVGQFTAIAADTITNTILIAYFDATHPGLKLARKTGNGLWQFSYIDADGTVGLYNSFNQRGDEIAYFDNSKHNLKYAQGSGTSWTVSTVDSLGDVGRYASIATFRGTTFISYYDNTNKNLKFAEKTGAGPWSITTIDQAGDVGQSTATAVDSTGRPVVLYYDLTNQNLKFAERFNGIWITNVVASGGNVGRFSGAAINRTTQLPNAVYYDETRGILRYAKGAGQVTGVEEPLPPPPGPSTSALALKVRVNPVRPPAAVDLVASSPVRVTLRIFDVYGRLVRSLYDGSLDAGAHSFQWDGRDDLGRAEGSGIFFASAVSGTARVTTRLVLIR